MEHRSMDDRQKARNRATVVYPPETALKAASERRNMVFEAPRASVIAKYRYVKKVVKDARRCCGRVVEHHSYGI